MVEVKKLRGNARKIYAPEHDLRQPCQGSSARDQQVRTRLRRLTRDVNHEVRQKSELN